MSIAVFGYIGLAWEAGRPLKYESGKRSHEMQIFFHEKKAEKESKSMFDTMKVAKNIKEARIAQNMTQMNLADAIEVSYQAVSNWERGNSMPDIAKLGQLCQILQISLDQLLGTEDETKTVTKIIHEDKAATGGITMEEIGNIAPLLSPSEIKRLVNVNLQEKAKEQAPATGSLPPEESEQKEAGQKEAETEKKKNKIDGKTLISLAPFLEPADLDEILQELEEEMDIGTIKKLAPFISSRSLDKLVLRLTDSIGMENIRGLMPFVSQECLEELLGRCDEERRFEQVAAFAPFLSGQYLEEELSRCKEDVYLERVIALAPFLSSKFLKELVRRAKS